MLRVNSISVRDPDEIFGKQAGIVNRALTILNTIQYHSHPIFQARMCIMLPYKFIKFLGYKYGSNLKRNQHKLLADLPTFHFRNA